MYIFLSLPNFINIEMLIQNRLLKMTTTGLRLLLREDQAHRSLA